MSGHSKWATIKRKKGALDAKRGKVFTKIIKEVTVAARIGGSDPDANPRLRLAVQNAKGANMPKDNIERAIKKGSGADGADYIETTYEGNYGSVGIYVECTTDNLNRTVANIRAAFNRHGGNLGTNGSLSFMFSRKGVFEIVQPAGLDLDDFTLELIDAGAEDVEAEEGYITVTSAMEDFGTLQKKLEEMKITVENAELRRIPGVLTKLDDETFKKAMKFIEVLEDDDDVQQVYHNIETTEEQLDLID
ncbi:MAG: YebC/PmpR family DNA-binding transcriptional regulator [Ferruginibacter sp.]|nr:YebC/PmpR family DNA-binding transcriptional regulator [Cytophagales bacterium]